MKKRRCRNKTGAAFSVCILGASMPRGPSLYFFMDFMKIASDFFALSSASFAEAAA